MNNVMLQCPYCKSEGNCSHAMIKLVSTWEAEVYNKEDFRKELCKWLSATQVHVFNDLPLFYADITPFVGIMPSKWGSAAFRTSDDYDYLFFLMQLIGQSDILNECIYDTISGIEDDINLKTTHHAYLKNDFGTISAIDKECKSLISANDELYVETHYWANDYHQIAKEADTYLQIFFSLQNRASLISSIASNNFCNLLRNAMNEQKGNELCLQKENCEKLLWARGQLPPEDTHRNNSRKPFKIKGLSYWDALSYNYGLYRNGFKNFMKLKRSNQQLHNMILQLGKSVINKSILSDHPKNCGQVLMTMLDDIRRVLFNKENVDETYKHKEKQYDTLRKLANESKISAAFLPSYSFLSTLGNALKHWGEQTDSVPDSKYTVYVELIMISELFENILPELIKET